MIHAWLSSTRNGLFIDCFFSLFAMTTRSTASSNRIEQAVAETKGLLWLLDDVLQAQDDLLALLAKPTELPMEPRERLLIFCDRVGKACSETESDSLAPTHQQRTG